MGIRRLPLAVAFAALLVCAHARAEALVPAAHVLRVSGVVEVTATGERDWRPARAGLALAPGASLRTGDTGRAEVELASGTVRVYENSLLRMPEGDPKSERVRLREGAALFDISLPRGRQFHVETPEAVAAVKGTRFLVEATRGGVSAGVYEGVVELTGLGEDAAPPVLVREGFGATLGDDAFELVVLERPDPWRDWESGARAPDVAPPPAAPDDAGEAVDPAADAVHDAVIEATDAVIDSAYDRAEEPIRIESAPAKQDVDAIDVIDAMDLKETIESPVRDTLDIELERPDLVEPIEKQESPTRTDSGN